MKRQLLIALLAIMGVAGAITAQAATLRENSTCFFMHDGSTYQESLGTAELEINVCQTVAGLVWFTLPGSQEVYITDIDNVR